MLLFYIYITTRIFVCFNLGALCDISSNSEVSPNGGNRQILLFLLFFVFVYVKFCLFVCLFVCLSYHLNFCGEFFFFENSAPLVFGIHQEQDDLKMVVASAGVALIVDDSVE